MILMPTPGQFRAARAFLNLSQKELALHAGVTVISVVRIEDDEKGPGSVLASKVVSVLKFFGEHGVELDPPEEDRCAVLRYK